MVCKKVMATLRCAGAFLEALLHDLALAVGVGQVVCYFGRLGIATS
jgi:hypothetical protein